MPIIILIRALFTLLSWAVLALAVYLLWRWYEGNPYIGSDGLVHRMRGPLWWCVASGFLFAWSFLGRSVVLAFMPSRKDDPKAERLDGPKLAAPGGMALQVQSKGRRGGPTVILTHGWGLNSTAWGYAGRALKDRRVITWDLPGLGRSHLGGGKVTIDRFAQALGVVIESAGSGPIVLVGHSIGGMTTQTLWRACPPAALRHVVGVVLVDTTYENPINTMWLSGLWRVLRWPVIEPICWLMIALSPLVWLSNWQSYLSGSNQLAMRLTGFGKFATREQVDLTARLACEGPPGVQAKGNLAMFRWSAVDAIPRIPVPMLILTGSKDIVTLPSASRVIAGAALRARVEVIEGCGHMGFMERADVYNAAIDRFVDEVTRPAGAPDRPLQ